MSGSPETRRNASWYGRNARVHRCRTLCGSAALIALRTAVTAMVSLAVDGLDPVGGNRNRLSALPRTTAERSLRSAAPTPLAGRALLWAPAPSTLSEQHLAATS
jgi:hypothetical protein